MQVDRVDPEILVFRGDTYESVATAFVRNADVLLVDALASRRDAEWMRHHLEEELGKKVRVIVSTHYMSDHMAGMRLFPDAQILAQRLYSYTFLSQKQRSPEEDAEFVRPTVVFGNEFTLEWGRHTLRAFHNPGKTVCSTVIDVADCDLLLCGDTVVGNIVYISSSSPELIREALDRLLPLRRGRVIPGHMGVQNGDVIENARHYLDRIGERVVAARRDCSEPEAVLAIAIEDCVAPGVRPTAFEREWHDRNLQVILERRLFAVGDSRRGGR
jgi:glyoxylase-like metal-dependent hydrolase (beta-lactamase superfamily II)